MPKDGTTPEFDAATLKAYGIAETAYSGVAEMYKLMPAMRVRIISAPAFTGDKMIAAKEMVYPSRCYFTATQLGLL